MAGTAIGTIRAGHFQWAVPAESVLPRRATALGAGPTWGIEGPDFLAAFTLAGILLLLAVITLRIVTGKRHPGVVVDPRTLRPLDLAYLSGGPFHAVAVGLWLAHLRQGPPGDARQNQPWGTALPETDWHDPLQWSVAPAAAGGVTVRKTMEDPAVRLQLRARHAELAGRGLLRSYSSIRVFRCLKPAALAWFVLGLVRIVAGTANGQPAGNLAVVLGVLGILLLIAVFRVPAITDRGLRLVRELRRQTMDLNPRRVKGYAGVDPARVALGVAVFGTAGLWIAAPAYAAAAGVPAAGSLAAGGAYYAGAPVASSGGSGSGGSSSCSSSGGCGGGGCGG